MDTYIKKIITVLLILLFTVVVQAQTPLIQSTEVIIELGMFTGIDGITPTATLDVATMNYAYLIADDATVTDISGNTWAVVNASVPGFYKLTLTAANTSTLGDLIIAFRDDDACVPKTFMRRVVPANTVNSLSKGTAYLITSMSPADATTANAILADTNDIEIDLNDGIDVVTIETVDATDQLTTYGGGSPTSINLILADTDDLQTNQAAWATATGFATETKQDIITTMLTDEAVSVALILVDTSSTLDDYVDGVETLLTMIQSEAVTLGEAIDAVDNYVDTEITTLTTMATAEAASVTLILEDTGTTLDGYVDTVEITLSMIQSHTITIGSNALTEDSNIGIDLDDITGTLDDGEVANDVQVDVLTIETVDATDQLTTYGGGAATTVNTIHSMLTDEVASVNLILADTDNLQSSQAAWATATGFATSAQLTTYHAGLPATIQAECEDAIDAKIDTTAGVIDEVAAITGHTVQSGDSYPIVTMIQSEAITLGSDLATLVNGIDDNAWDDGTRTLTALDEDDTTIDLDGTTIDASCDVSCPTSDEIQAECTDALNAYDPPTRAELTTDKDTIVTEVNANETKIDTLDTVADAIKAKTDDLNFTGNNVQSTPQTNVTVGTNSDKTGYGLAVDQSGVTVGTVNALGTQAKADVEAETWDALDTAFTDVTGLTENGTLWRLRKFMWCLLNKMSVTNVNGNTKIYKDDNTTEAISVDAALTNDGTTTTRKKME